MAQEIACSTRLALEPDGELRHRELARMVKKACRYDCGVMISVGPQRVDGKSLPAVAGLDFGPNAALVIDTWGVDANECLSALTKIATLGLNRPATNTFYGAPR